MPEPIASSCCSLLYFLRNDLWIKLPVVLRSSRTNGFPAPMDCPITSLSSRRRFSMSPENPSRRYITLSSRKTPLPFSDAVRVGDTLYISGCIGIDPATGMAPADVDHELRLLFEGFAAVLKTSGMSFDDLVWVQVFSPDLSLWERFNAVYVEQFSG